MEFIEKTLEMRGIRRDEIIDYFININGENTEYGKITGQDWEVKVSDEKFVTLGALIIPVTIVVLRSKKEIFEQMYSEFRLNFLRAGG